MGRSPLAARSITASELAVLSRAVEVGALEGADVPSLDPLSSLQVVGRCDCGCASVDFQRLGPGQVPSLVADAMGETPNGERVNVLVFASDGQFTQLEIVGYSDDPAPLPIPSTVRAWANADQPPPTPGR